MAVTMEQLQQELAALKAQVDGITAPPTDYYTSRWSGEEIDNGVARAIPGGGIDEALAGKVNYVNVDITGSVLDWAKAQRIPTNGNATPSTTDMPENGYYAVNVMIYAAGAWRVIVAHSTADQTTYIRACINDVWHDWQQLATTSQLCNPNLIDNWYFVGGGGPGQFPVNQRGQTEYTDLYGMDRWLLAAQVSSLKIEPTHIVLKNYLVQRFSIQYYLFPLTFAILYVDGTLGVAHDFLDKYAPCGHCQVQYARGENALYILGNASIVAVKMEIGSTQTLAHKEGDTWVLNEIPNYAEQLARCQRYLFVSTLDQRFIGMCEMDSAAGGQGVIWTPVQLRTTPVATGRLSIYGSRNNTDATSLSILGAGPTGVYATFTCDGLVNTPGSGILYNMDSSAPLILSAEL